MATRAAPSGSATDKRLQAVHLCVDLKRFARNRLFSQYYPVGGKIPSCCISPSRLASPHSSAILPFSRRKISIPVMVMGLPVGGSPMKAPL